MDLTGDELAGVVDLFGCLTRAELDRAVEELAYKRGDDHDADAVAAAVEAALDSYHLVAVETDFDTPDDRPVLVAGPVAFPALPDGATDLPHIMDVPDRSLDDETVVAAARESLEEDALAAVEAGDTARAARLVDVSYDLEAWGSTDASDLREILDRV
jgi:hypothetical protein